MATRRKYAAEFKQEAVQLVRSANVPASQIARDLGIDPNMATRGKNCGHPALRSRLSVYQ